MESDEIFSGKYTAVNSGSNAKLTLKSEDDIISGTIVLDGKLAKIKATRTDLSFSGILFDEFTNQGCAVKAIQEGKVLKLSIILPLSDQAIVFNFEKENSESPLSFKEEGEKNSMLVGTWRYTDVISSGSGESYASIATDYFFEFNADGTVLTWTGKSGGGTRDVSLQSGEGQANKLGWYTTDKTIHFVDLTTKEESQATFYAESNRVMFSNGNNKRVYERIR
ncbi:hypothetical protein IRZ83_01075 [Flavobacterium sp. JLP]|uniref:hypothetical protein n=1 Tax=Flavobacterium sp. JLP TaxID=2783793 RepID=UPI00188ACDF9|nr:hypothetical protein [Flavobacterium sp. JLP]MBF4505239.1 hypothetical protein [Flavobacterium sp. JLP]